MLPVKDTRTILYRLLKGNYVTLQEVSKTGDHNPQRTFYVWRVDIPKVRSLASLRPARCPTRPPRRRARLIRLSCVHTRAEEEGGHAR